LHYIHDKKGSRFVKPDVIDSVSSAAYVPDTDEPLAIHMAETKTRNNAVVAAAAEGISKLMVLARAEVDLVCAGFCAWARSVEQDPVRLDQLLQCAVHVAAAFKETEEAHAVNPTPLRAVRACPFSSVC
jgi:hypothetical protein